MSQLLGTYPTSQARRNYEQQRNMIMMVQDPDQRQQLQSMMQTMQQEIHNGVETIHQAFRSKIDFYGKVVDEQGASVSGANTSYSASTGDINSNPTVSGPITDANGRFAIIGEHGASIFVTVRHQDYYATNMARQDFIYAKALSEEGAATPTISQPAIFILHRKGKAEPLIYHSIEVRLPMDESPVSVDINKGVVAAGHNSIVFALRSNGSTLPLNQYHPFDLSFKIEIPEGGLLERNNTFQFQAPSDGYLTKVVYSDTAMSPRGKWKESVQNEFFVLLPSRQYARIKVSMLPIKGACKIESFVNPDSNSRNLEYDPKMKPPVP